MKDSPGELICAYQFKCNSINDVGELHYVKVEDFELVKLEDCTSQELLYQTTIMV